jgi:hypothetical protein
MAYRILLCAVFGSAVCQAEPYWIRYDAALGLFPEQDGWTRYASDPPAERWLEDGKLFIDSRADWFITEQYGEFRPGMTTLNPGETFLMHWRVKVDQIIGYADPGVGVQSEDQHLIILKMGMDFIELAYGDTRATFAPGEWHEFELRSANMTDYELWVDGVFGFSAAALDDTPGTPTVAWGDLSSHCSLSEWDYFEFGVVPEPSGALLLLATCAACLLKCSAGRRGRI